LKDKFYVCLALSHFNTSFPGVEKGLDFLREESKLGKRYMPRNTTSSYSQLTKRSGIRQSEAVRGIE